MYKISLVDLYPKKIDKKKHFVSFDKTKRNATESRQLQLNKFKICL